MFLMMIALGVASIGELMSDGSGGGAYDGLHFLYMIDSDQIRETRFEKLGVSLINSVLWGLIAGVASSSACFAIHQFSKRRLGSRRPNS